VQQRTEAVSLASYDGPSTKPTEEPAMQGNIGMDRVAGNAGARLADVSAEIAAAGASAHGSRPEKRQSIKANNLGLIGVTVKCKFSGREMDIPVSLELYEDLDPQALHNYLADAAQRMGACEPISEVHRLHLLPDSY
jgi:hypothetical protein